jgi:hypothetical protein
MRYEHISAFQIFGLTHDPAMGDVEIYRSDDHLIRAIFTSDVNGHGYIVDRGRSLGLFMLRGFAGQGKQEDFAIALEKEIKAIQEQRCKDTGASVILLISITGEIDTTLNGPTRTINDFTFGIDLIDKEAIKASHRNTISAIVSAACLSIDPPTDVRRLLDDVCLKDDDDKCIYSISFSMSAEGYSSRKVTDEIVGSVSLQAKDLLKIGDLSRVTRLLLMTSDKRNDRLRSFLTGWSALEIFVNKTFPFYEQELKKRITGDDTPPGTVRYLDRIKDALDRGKYSLLEKFTVIAACLGGNIIEADIDLFKKLKDVRDDFFHKQEIAENNLPTADLRSLLSRYLRAHVAFTKS